MASNGHKETSYTVRRLPLDLVAWLRVRAAETRTPAYEIVRRALEQYRQRQKKRGGR